MNRLIANIKPAVKKEVLLFLAGFMWFGVGTILLFLSFFWLNALQGHGSILFGGIGVAVALVVHHFGFLKIVDKNLGRILPMEGTKCIFAFLSWKSYIIVAVMVTMGKILRHSPLPKSYLSILYIGIGLALILSSVRYLRALMNQIRKSKLKPIILPRTSLALRDTEDHIGHKDILSKNLMVLTGLKLNIFRIIAIFITQLPLILFVGAKFDLIFGFNRMDSGFASLLFLFILVPLLNLSWIIIETIRSVRFLRHQRRAVTFLMPLIAVLFFVESIAIDLYIASHARM